MLGLDPTSGDPVYAANLQVTDSINGGDGNDSLNITTEGEINTVNATIVSVETMNLTSAGDVTFDTTKITGLTALNVIKGVNTSLESKDTTAISVTGATGTVDVLGGSTQTLSHEAAGAVNMSGAKGAINVTLVDQVNNVSVENGTTVTVNASYENVDASGNVVSVGNDTTADLDNTHESATGAVTVTATATADDQDDAATAQIGVYGGSTVTVNVSATSTSKDADSDNTAAISDITVWGDGSTTDVTIKQTISTALTTDAAVGGVTETASVKFGALKSGDAITIEGLTFTASKNLTANEVAAAFANLSKSDKQTATGIVANGVFSGASSADYTSAAANGDTVVFTYATANSNDTTDLEATLTNTSGNSTAAVVTITNGVAVTSAEAGSTNVATYGDVIVDEDDYTNNAAAITTITLDGFNNATLGDNESLDALTTLNLSNSAGKVSLTTASTTLALNVNAITGGGQNLDFSAAGSSAIENITITAQGAASDFGINLTSLKELTVDAQVDIDFADLSEFGDDTTGSLEKVVIKGAGEVILGDVSSQVTLNSFNASANTGGVTATIETEIDTAAITGDITEYVFSEGNDVVTLSNDVIETKVTLGAGDDFLALAEATVAGTVEVAVGDVKANLSGGTGTNTIDMEVADAEALSNDATFEGKISGFNRLSLREGTTLLSHTVDLANMDDISYVITANTADVAEVTEVTVTATPTDVVNTGTLSIVVGGVTYSVDADTDVDTTLDNLAAAIAADARVDTADWNVTTAGVLTITGEDGYILQVGELTSTLNSNDDVSGVNEVTSSELFITNMANNGTVELTAAGLGATVVMTDATGDADTLNVVTGDNAGNVGTVAVAGVETINVTTTNVFVDELGLEDVYGNDLPDGKDETASASTLYLTGDDLATVTVAGGGDLTLTTAAAGLTMVDATDLTGALVYTAVGATAGTEVKGGSGKDTLTSSGEGDVLRGNDGDDTFNVYDLAEVYAGAGKDKFNFYATTNLAKVSTVMDTLGSGDTFNLFYDGLTTNEVTKFYASGAQYNATVATTFELRLEAALEQTADGEASWFNFGGNTYIVIDGTDSTASTTNTYADTYEAGVDTVIELTGTYNLGTGASFNATSGTLEIA